MQQQNLPNKIDEILTSNPDLPIETLLEHEEIIEELKKMNAKLFEYFQKNQHCIKQLILNFTNQENVSKYSQLSVEIIECEAHPIISVFFNPDKSYLKLLFKYLENNELNDTFSGFFSRIVSVILTLRHQEIIEFIFCNI